MSKQKLYYRFTEHNSWEGETWNFYVPIAGNSEKIKTIKRKLMAPSDYQFDTNRKYTEAEVDALVEQGRKEVGYMAPHQKVAKIKSLRGRDPDAVFYKGKAFERAK